MAKLYELREEYNALLNMLEEGNDEIPEDALYDTLEAVAGEIKDKAVNIAVMIKDLQSDVEAFKNEESRLAQRRRVLENTVDRLKEYVTKELAGANIDQIKDDPRAAISFRRSKSVEIEDEDKFIDWARELRPDFLTIKTTIAKANIKKVLEKDSDYCPFAKVVEKNSIQIK